MTNMAHTRASEDCPGQGVPDLDLRGIRQRLDSLLSFMLTRRVDFAGGVVGTPSCASLVAGPRDVGSRL